MPPPKEDEEMHDDMPETLDADDALEEIQQDVDGDVAMDSDDEGEEINLVNDSSAYMDSHKSSVFCIASHPLHPTIIATGGSEGEEDDAPGMGYITDVSAAPGRPVLPASYSSDPVATHAQPQLEPSVALKGHTDSVTSLAFTKPNGDYLITGGMDGRIRAWAVAPVSPDAPTIKLKLAAKAQEVKEVNFLISCPSTERPNTFALGASDGSVWVYTVEGTQLEIVQSYFSHAASVTAGAWTPDGNLLATVDEEGSLYVWDVFGVAGGKGLANQNGGQSVVALTAADGRFAVDGGLYSVAVEPKGAFLAVGGAGGHVRIISLPKLDAQSQKGGKGKGKNKGAESHAAQIITSLQTHTDGVETLAFAPEPLTMLATGSVDGSIAVFDTSRNFALRRHLVGAHDEFAVVKVDWVREQQWALTSCGMDGIVRRWDLRARATAAAEGGSDALVKEWRGHRGEGDGGGVMGFVQTNSGSRVVTAGDDGVVLVFDA